MANLSRNAFINKHSIRICVYFQFPDYSSNVQYASGKIIPTPNKTASAMIKAKKLSGDSALFSKEKGKIQVVMLSDQADIHHITGNLPRGKSTPGDGSPCNDIIVCTVDSHNHLEIAKQLGLF